MIDTIKLESYNAIVGPWGYMKEEIKKIRVLLIDDDEVDIMNIERTFVRKKFPHKLMVAHNGMEALTVLKEGTYTPNIILLDINMPQMSGFEFLKELRGDPALRSIPVFIISTSNEPRDRDIAYSYNVAGYIVKSISSEKFNFALANLMQFIEVCEFPGSG